MNTTSVNEPICSIESALNALNSDDDQIRYYVVWWLGKHQVHSAGEALCAALQDERYRTPQGGYPLRRQAARALAQLKNPQAVPALLTALNCEEDIQLREAAIQALAAIGDQQAVPHLLTLLKSEQAQPYEALIEALGTLEVWSAKPLIEPFLKHDSERVQCAAARYFYLLTKEGKYIQRLVENLNHDNVYLRWAAAFDLGAIGHLEAADAILNAKIASSLKLLNLKRILEAVLISESEDEALQPEKSQTLMEIIDNLLIQL